MKSIISSLLLITLFIAACKKEDTIQPGDNLITNASFEDNGNFSLDGWVDNNSSSDTDVPGGGGNFSLKIAPATSPAEGYANFEINDLQGTKSFKLSAWVKSFGDWPGSVALRKVDSDGIVTILATQASSTNTWEEKIIEITTTLSTGDKLLVHLSAGSTEAGTPDQYALFDLIELKEL